MKIKVELSEVYTPAPYKPSTGWQRAVLITKEYFNKKYSDFYFDKIADNLYHAAVDCLREEGKAAGCKAIKRSDLKEVCSYSRGFESYVEGIVEAADDAIVVEYWYYDWSTQEGIQTGGKLASGGIVIANYLRERAAMLAAAAEEIENNIKVLVES